MTPIRPELLAEKIQAARNGEPEAPVFAQQLAGEPDLLETLCFITEMSRRPGGLDGFVQKLIEASPGRFQTKAMREAGPPQSDGCYSLAQCLAVWMEQRKWDRSENPAFYHYSYTEPRREGVSPGSLKTLSYHDFLGWFIRPEVTVKDARGDGAQSQALRIGFERFNLPFLKLQCLETVRRELPDLLKEWCEDERCACTNPNYYCDLLATLRDFMDRHAAETALELAETEVTKIVFRELEFARSQNVPVPIVGASRFGKTKAVSVWCKMRPGLARLVTVPDSNRERDFFTAHADAFGISYGVKTPVSELKRKVEFVHRHLGLFLVYDEAHFLVPVNYHQGTPPCRLNWIRCQVIDRDCGCAFFATPQSYRETLDAYVKKTGYCMEQWLGRLAPAVVLPESLDSADVLAVARNHFPDVPEPYLKLISARAMQSEGYLKNVEITVKRARFLAGERGRNKPELADVQDAIGYIMPAAVPQMANVAPRRRTAAPALQPVSRAPAALLPTLPRHEFPRRDSLLKVGELEPVLAS